MKWITALALPLALLAALATWWYDPSQIARRQAEAAAEVARVAQEAQLAQAHAAALAPWWTWLGILGIIALALLLGVGVAYVTSLAYLDVRRRATTAMPTRDGRLPVPLTELPRASVAALGASHAARQLAVARQELPAALTLPELLEAPPER